MKITALGTIANKKSKLRVRKNDDFRKMKCLSIALHCSMQRARNVILILD